MSNRLKFTNSPYLLAHKENPVDWYPWGAEAFERAGAEDKPVFLSIGYSSCHWCHVMAHESFEDAEIAEILNRRFISVKVDKEERPDVDSVYMSVCQAFTGSGGWPTSIFMTADKKPFFAGTYFPKTNRGGMVGMKELLNAIDEAWRNERDALLQQSERIISFLKRAEKTEGSAEAEPEHLAVDFYERIYDGESGGFGSAPKFPAPHNIIFLLSYYERYKNQNCLSMAEHTLIQMYRGGLFDHIGSGFCRYSTDEKFLVPHFEKMLYDNALLISAYCKAYEITKKELYLEVAQKTADYILREMTAEEGGFYSAQDADSEGEEGKYYLFTAEEIKEQLGRREAKRFMQHFGISEGGNFEGKNIPNLLDSNTKDKSFEESRLVLYRYRKTRCTLPLDDKILTAWNGLMIAALCELYLSFGQEQYLTAAIRADEFVWEKLWDGENLYVSYREGKRGVKGFLDDYAGYIFALLRLYRAGLKKEYLDRARMLCDKVIKEFGDGGKGFYLYGKDSEELIVRPKDTYDGAIPSGNSLMAYNLVRLELITSEETYGKAAREQLEFMAAEASRYPSGHAMYLTALLQHKNPPSKVVIVPEGRTDIRRIVRCLPADTAVVLLAGPTGEYPLKNGKTTYYVCRNRSCHPPVNSLEELCGSGIRINSQGQSPYR